ncbi:hypothetical protein D3C84_866860 [compost metagenome]
MVGQLQGQGDIDFAHQQVLHQFATVGAGQLADDVRVVPGPGMDRRWQQRQGQRRCRANPQAVAWLAAQALGQAPHPLQAFRDLVDLALQFQGFGGRL